MNENPLFSVLIANYNNGNYLMEAIESVKLQSYTNWEIIIVDDGSTDNSHELYREFEKDNRIHIYYNYVNRGCGFTKRRCVEMASGEICGFLDPDDTLLVKAIEIMVNEHQLNANYSLIYSRCYLCDTNMKIVGENKFIELKKDNDYLNNRWLGAMNFCAFKKVFYDKTIGISDYIKAGVDQDLYFKLEEVGEFRMLDVFTYNYRQGLNSAISSNWVNLWFWNLEVRRNAFERRGLAFEKYLIDDFKYILNEYANQKSLEKENMIRNSKSYKIGKFITKTLNKLKLYR